MLRIAVIGGGNHSRDNHLPALARYADLNPGVVELAAFCDLRPEVAHSIAQQYGFTHCFTELGKMLAAERLHGCIAVTPLAATAPIASQIISAGIPLLMEKPPGATIQEADEIRSMVKDRQAHVMVSMNRRFDPALAAACALRAGRPIEYLHATMLRHNRIEADFFAGTAIHCVDAVRMIAGDVQSHTLKTRHVDGTCWYHVEFSMSQGATRCVLDVLPNCGSKAESYELFGAGFRILARAGELDSGEVIQWEKGKIVNSIEPARGMPSFVKNGTYDETAEFISSLIKNQAPHPSPAEVRQSLELCHCIQKEAT